jgi:hypothetical protein
MKKRFDCVLRSYFYLLEDRMRLQVTNQTLQALSILLSSKLVAGLTGFGGM